MRPDMPLRGPGYILSKQNHLIIPFRWSVNGFVDGSWWSMLMGQPQNEQEYCRNNQLIRNIETYSSCGRNPANQVVDSLSHYLQGLAPSQVFFLGFLNHQQHYIPFLAHLILQVTFPSATAFEDMASGEVVERCVGLHLGSCIPVTLQVGCRTNTSAGVAPVEKNA